MLACVGVIYHFNPRGVLFEFSATGSEDAVGIVKPTAIKIKGDETIPANANTVDLLSKYLQVGDELLCHVKRQANPVKFVYDEEEEEVSGSGKVTKKTKKVEIYPEWSASTAELVTDANRDKKSEFASDPNHADADENFDLGIGDQYVDALDYDDVLFIDDVPEFEEEKAGVASLNSSKTEQPAADQPKETPAAPAVKKTTMISLVKTVAPAASTPSTTTTTAPATTTAVSTNSPPCFKDKARLVQLKKPDSCKTGDSKVTTAIFEILTGRFANRFISVTSCNMFVFGHNLGIANLMYHLQHGDEATVEYRVAKLKAPQDLMGVSSNVNPLTTGEVPFVKSLWIGTETKDPVSVAKDKGLIQWMLARKISAKQFTDWVRNALPWKPYHPLASSTQKAKVIRYIRAKSLAVDAVLLDLRDGVNRGVGIMLNTDFYVCGVNVLYSDLSHFLKPGDYIQCQVRPLLNADRYNMKLELSMIRNLQVSHVAYLGFVGPQRPAKPDLTPPEAGKVLEEYLSNKGITMEKFVALLKTPKPSVVIATAAVPQGFGHIRPPGFGTLVPGPQAFAARLPGAGVAGFGFRLPGPVMVPPPGSGPMPNVPVQMPPVSGPIPAAPVQKPTAPGPVQPPNASLPPPNGAIPGVFGPFIPQVSVAIINVATNLAARAVNVDSKDMRIRNLLHNPTEMEIAAKVARNLTEALLVKLQGNLQARMNSNLPGVPELTKQQKDIEAIHKSLSGGGDVQEGGATRSASQERSGLDNGSKPPLKRSGSLPKETVVKKSRFDDLQPPSVRSRLGPAVENSSLDPVPLNVASVQPSKPSVASHLNPFQPQSSVGQSGFDSGLVNPFLPPEQANAGAKASRWTPAYGRMQDMKSETSGLSANQMAREAEKARQAELQQEQQRLWEEYLEAKKKKEEEAMLEADRLAFEAEQNRMREEQRRRMEEEDRLRQEAEARRQAELQKQREAELAQARLEEEERVREFLAEEKLRKQQEEEERIRMEIRRELERKQMEEERQRRAQEEFERKLREEHERRRAQEELEKKRRLEEQERLRQQEEMERKRKMEEEERERKRRIEEEERERMRREAERKRLEEQERLRVQQEQERKRREEEEKLRLAQEELERKRKQEEEEAKRQEQQMEMMWRMEMEKKLKKQQEDDERERKMREMRGSGSSGFQRSGPSSQGSGFKPWAANNPLPPPPKLSGVFGQEAGSNPASAAPPPVVGGFRRSDVFGDRVPPAPNEFWKKFESSGPPPSREPPRQSTIANLKEASRMFQRQGGGGPAGNGGNPMNPFMGVPPPPVIAEKARGPNNDRRY